MTRHWTSDLHIGHQNIIRLAGRPFSTVDEMNQTVDHLPEGLREQVEQLKNQAFLEFTGTNIYGTFPTKDLGSMGWFYIFNCVNDLVDGWTIVSEHRKTLTEVMRVYQEDLADLHLIAEGKPLS